MIRDIHPGRVGGCCLLILVLLLFSASAYGQRTSYLGVGAGVFNIMDNDPKVYGLIDYRPPLGAYGIGTYLTLAGTEEEVYLSGGILKDFFLSRSVVLTPSFGCGLYHQNGGMALGSTLEFRSAVKLSYELPNSSRIGVRFGHVSNAGLGEINPGSEIISLIYSVPLGGE